MFFAVYIFSVAGIC